MPASVPPGPTYEALLETLHASAGWKADAGRDLLLLKHLQVYPVDWLVSRAVDYALADGMHSYQGFKNWCQSPRAQEKWRLWEQEQRARAQRARNSASAHRVPHTNKRRKKLDCCRTQCAIPCPLWAARASGLERTAPMMEKLLPEHRGGRGRAGQCPD